MEMYNKEPQDYQEDSSDSSSDDHSEEDIDFFTADLDLHSSDDEQQHNHPFREAFGQIDSSAHVFQSTAMVPTPYPEIKMSDYKGKEFDKSFGKLVRKLDRMRMRLNERLKANYLIKREQELEVPYETIYKKMLFHAAVSEEDYSPQREQIKKDCQLLMQDQAAKEWKAKGKTDRDWSRIKVIAFDDQKQLQAMSKNDFKGNFNQMKAEMKQLLKKHDANEEKKKKKKADAAADDGKKKKKKKDGEDGDKKKKKKGKSTDKNGAKEEVKESEIKKFIVEQKKKKKKKDKDGDDDDEVIGKKKKSKKVNLKALGNALPTNLQESYEQFFQSNFKVNPQFQYKDENQAKQFVEQFNEPDGKYLQIAIQILDSFLKEYGSETAHSALKGKLLDQEETHNAIRVYLGQLGVEEEVSVNFQEDQIAPTSVSHDPKTGLCKLNVKLPCEYHADGMLGVLDHEIGTHFLRKRNEKSQKWYKKREKFDMKTCIATEEGLACTNQLVSTVQNGNIKPFLFKSALNYYSAIKAKDMGFVELFNDLYKYLESPEKRWKRVLRVKRGLTNTGQKGGLYKDKDYLEGAVQVLQQRRNLNFKGLMCGKISLYDLKREIINRNLNYDGQLLPKFMDDMDEYMRCLDIIAETNHIEIVEDEKIDYDAITSRTVVVDSDEIDGLSGDDDQQDSPMF